MTDHRDLFPFLAALSLAFSATFWSQCVAAEVYTLHNFLTAVILFLLLRTGGPFRPAERQTARRLYAIAFLLGLSLTNHLTTALLVPAAVLGLLLDRGRWTTGDWLIAAGLLLLGLSVYLFIPLRWPALHEGRWMTAAEFLRYASGGQFHGALQLSGWRDPIRWQIVGRLLIEPFGWPGIALAAPGVLTLAERHRKALWITGLTFLAFFAYGLTYYVADIAVFLLPAHLILAIWMGLGAVRLAELARALAPAMRGSWWPVAITLFSLVPLSLAWVNLPDVDRSSDRGGYDWGRYALSQPLEPESAVLADTERFAPLYYLQQIEGIRPDLEMVLLGTEEQYQADLQRRLSAGETVYLARYLPHLDGLYMRSVGPLAEVRGNSPEPTSPSIEPLATFHNSIDLVGAEIEDDPQGRGLWHVTFHWRAFASVGQDLVVRVRLVDADGHARWTGKGSRPVNGLYPTNAWATAVPIADYHAISVAPWLPAGAYVLEVGLFPQFSDQGLDAHATPESWVSIGTIDVEQASDEGPLPQRRLIAFEGGGWLVGLDAPSEVTADGTFPIQLGWRQIGDQDLVALSWDAGEEDGTDAWGVSLSNEVVRTRHVLTAPSLAGRHLLRLKVQGGQACCGWLATPQDSCALTWVLVRTDTEELANFGGRVILTRAEVNKATAAPGERIPVHLRWRGVRAMDVDYTVFVHLVGPDGRLHGQVDSWPVQGSYPTSQWTPGDDVRDVYEVPLKSDAPAGRYRIQVGLYELASMQRLSVFDAQGMGIGDSYVVGFLEVER